MLKRTLISAVLFTAITTLLLGVAYPLAITAVAQLLFRDRANGSLIEQNGHLIGSSLIGQSFTGAAYFHSRPSPAGTGYDAANSSGSNLGPTSKTLHDTVLERAATEHVAGAATEIPVDLVTASGSGLDPDLTPAAALYQIPRVAAARHLPIETVQHLVQTHITPRQFGLLGEPRVNVLELNLALNQLSPIPTTH